MPSPDQPWPWADSDRHAWPTGEDPEFKKQLELARLEIRKKRTDEEIARAKADSDAEIARRKAESDAAIANQKALTDAELTLAKVRFEADRAFEDGVYEAVVEVAKGETDRARASADFVQKAAAAIGGIYTAILGVTFSVAERPFPARGLVPAVFLGLAIVCSTYFLAWLPNPEEEHLEAEEEESEGSGQEPSLANSDISQGSNGTGHGDSSKPSSLTSRVNLTNDFIFIMRRRAYERRRWLRAGVVSLGAALIFLAAPFVALGDQTAEPDITWPSAAQAAPNAPEALRTILYQAQVNEAARTEGEAATGEWDFIWWICLALGVLAVLVLSQYPRGPRNLIEAVERLHRAALVNDEEFEDIKRRVVEGMPAKGSRWSALKSRLFSRSS